jgi:hypothetical protein
MTSATPDPDRLAIRATVAAYLAGYLGTDAARIAAAFHPQATLIATDAGRVEIDPVAAWIGRVEGRQARGERAPPATSETEVLDVAGDAAVARVRVQFAAQTVTDYLSLLKSADGWRIVNKIYTVAASPA